MFFQVRSELGIPDNVWHQIRVKIALTVDDLGDEFRPLFRAGWLVYIHRPMVLLSPDKLNLWAKNLL